MVKNKKSLPPHPPKTKYNCLYQFVRITTTTSSTITNDSLTFSSSLQVKKLEKQETSFQAKSRTETQMFRLSAWCCQVSPGPPSRCQHWSSGVFRLEFVRELLLGLMELKLQKDYKVTHAYDSMRHSKPSQPVKLFLNSWLSETMWGNKCWLLF